MQYYGLLGDYIGGVWGTLLTAATVLGVFLTFWWSRRVDYRAKTYQVFAEMMRTHEEIVQSLRIGSKAGRDTFSSVLREFYVIYKLTREVEADDLVWPISARIDIAYTCMFFGAHLSSEKILKNYGPEKIQRLSGAIHTERQKKEPERRQFGGHQLRLSHYFRNLFSAYTFIDGTNLSDEEKLSLGKVLRSKLSNHEQAVLALNIMSHLGAEWERTGLVEKYKPIKNLPAFFLTFDKLFTIKERFPYINFEWETTAHKTVKVYRLKFRQWSLVLLRRLPRRLTNRSSGPPTAAA
ncbi:putative phage abortive infection protein [Azonexus sp.]|uniref:putative phage abortive infection protein n=1 Tax=Azonexus sp. TaxID=1872668 RepID=UPI0027BADB3B|nr:putative phage abortive infection protein [Azonexus sp.]